LTYLCSARISYVDREKLEKLRRKKEKRAIKKKLISESVQEERTMNYSDQVTVNHDSENAAKVRDMKLENFDIAFGKDLLMNNCTISLIYGHRYGLVGRNGSGKSTLLRAISNRELHGIPANLKILHVEQEVSSFYLNLYFYAIKVVGDETTALQSLLNCDAEREQLLFDEKRILKEEPESSKLQKIYERLQTIDAFSAESRASSILAGRVRNNH
jgi:ATP-binding cassette subfamily F protein 3